MTHDYARQTTTSVASLRGSVLAVPVGSTEQHGPHLPLTTDTDLATALAHALAGAREDVVVAPPVAYGASGEHEGYAGTLSSGHDAAELLLVELGRSASASFDRILLISTHGGNRASVVGARDRLIAESRDVRMWSPSWGSATDSHAGHVETSLMLHLHPERVRMEAAPVGQTRPLGELMADLMTGGLKAVTETGVLGDATTAAAAAGAEIWARAVADLVGAVGDWPATAATRA